MANSETLIPIPGRLHSVASEGHVAGANEIFDDDYGDKGALQSAINAANIEALEDKVDKEEGKGLSANDYSDTEKAKVASHESALAAGGSVDTRIAAAINALDAEASQSAGSDGLALSVSEVDGKITSISGSIAAGTYATLDNGKVPSSQLPSYVDDVIEGYYYNNKFYKEAAHTTEITGETGKIYVDLSTNDSYRWSGSAYIKVGDSSGIAELQSQINAIKGGSSKSIATLDSQDTALGNRVTTLETAVGTGGSVDSRIAAAKSEVIGDASSDYNTLGKIEDALENNALLAQGDSSSVIADFDPQSDTLWKKTQVLSSAEQETVKHNIGVDKDIEMLEKLYENLTQSDIVVTEDHTQVASPSTNTIYREMGDASYIDWMYYGGAWKKMAEYDNAIDDVPTPGSNNLVKSGGVEQAIANVSNAFDISDNQHVNKVVCYIMESGSPRVDLTATNHRLGIAYYISGHYYNMLYLSRTGTSQTTVFSEYYDTAAECIASLKANPVRTNGTITVVFNGDNLSNESGRFDFKLIRPVNERSYNYHPNIYDNYFRNEGLFNIGSPLNNIIGELYITNNNLTARFVTAVMFTVTDQKYNLKFQISYINASGTASVGYIIENKQFDTLQDAIDYYNVHLAGKIVSMADGNGFAYFKPIENVDSIAINSCIAYPNVDVHDIIYSPMIERYLKNYRFNRSSVANQMVKELYINPNIIDYSTIDFVRISCGAVFSDTIYNVVYIYRTGGLGTVNLYQKTFDTLSDAINDYIGFKGNINGYVLFNDEYANKLEVGTYTDVHLADINTEMLSLDNNPRIERYFNHTTFGKTVVWEGDSIAAGNAYGNAAWRKPIELKYGMIGTSYAVGGSVITSNVINPDTQFPVASISGRIDEEVAANPNMQYFIFDGGTNDADRIGRIVHWKSGTEQSVHERTASENWPAKFGTWNETDFSGNYDKDTFCGALEYIIWKVMSSCRYVKIGYIVAQKMGVSTGLTFFNRLEYFREAMAICKKWGVPVINLWEDSWMNSNMPNQYDPSLSTAAEHVANGDFYVDTQHPAPAGYDYLSKLIGDWMNEL